MATKEELFAAVRLIKEHCKEVSAADCSFDCPLRRWCQRRWCHLATTPPQEWPDPEDEWPDPEEGGGK